MNWIFAENQATAPDQDMTGDISGENPARALFLSLSLSLLKKEWDSLCNSAPSIALSVGHDCAAHGWKKTIKPTKILDGNACENTKNQDRKKAFSPQQTKWVSKWAKQGQAKITV